MCKIMENMRINISFKTIDKWRDSEKLAEHIFDRMKNRGIYTHQIAEAIKRGAKRLRADGSIVAEFRWFKVFYREFRVENIRKIYPITVIEV